MCPGHEICGYLPALSLAYFSACGISLFRAASYSRSVFIPIIHIRKSLSSINLQKIVLTLSFFCAYNIAMKLNIILIKDKLKEMERRPAWLADKMKLSRAAVSLWFDGTNMPSHNNIDKMAEILGVEWFLLLIKD